MRFGLFLMPEPFPWSNWTLSYDLKLEEIVVAERFGYDEVWIGEHHTGAYENIPAPDIYIAKASALTHRIGLGTGTINLPYHDPFMVAERMAFLDHLTHGRLLYGFGGGGLVSDKLFPPGLQPAFALKKNYLILASSPEVIRSFGSATSTSG